MKQTIKKHEAAQAIHAGSDALHEVLALNQVADLVRFGDDSDDEIAQNQLLVLQNTIEEKLEIVHQVVGFVSGYFDSANGNHRGPKAGRKLSKAHRLAIKRGIAASKSKAKAVGK